jgi:hypothetical protein
MLTVICGRRSIKTEATDYKRQLKDREQTLMSLLSKVSGG